MRQDDSFEYTRRSRRVQEARRVFRTDLKGPGAKGLDDVAPFLELAGGQPLPALDGAVRHADRVHHHNEPQLGQRRPYLEDFVELRRR